MLITKHLNKKNKLQGMQKHLNTIQIWLASENVSC